MNTLLMSIGEKIFIYHCTLHSAESLTRKPANHQERNTIKKYCKSNPICCLKVMKQYYWPALSVATHCSEISQLPFSKGFGIHQTVSVSAALQYSHAIWMKLIIHLTIPNNSNLFIKC